MSDNTNMSKGWIVVGRVLKYLVAAGAICWLFLSGNLSLERLAAVRVGFALPCLVLFLFLNLTAQGVRWWCLLRFHGIRVSLAGTFRIFWIGNFFQVILPGVLGGEFARAYYLLRDDPQARFRGVLSVIVDRVMGLYVFFLLAVSAFAFLPAEAKSEGLFRYHCLVAVGVVLGLPACSAILLSKRVRSFVTGLLPGTAGRPGEGRAGGRAWLFAAFVLSVGSGLLMVAGFWIAGLALGNPVGYSASLMNVPLVVVANSLPISPGGIGVGESAAFVAFNQGGYAGGAELMILVRLVLSLLRLPGILFFLRSNRKGPT